MEFYSLYLKNCMFVTNKVCGKVNENQPGPDLLFGGAMGALAGGADATIVVRGGVVTL